ARSKVIGLPWPDSPDPGRLAGQGDLPLKLPQLGYQFAGLGVDARAFKTGEDSYWKASQEAWAYRKTMQRMHVIEVDSPGFSGRLDELGLTSYMVSTPRPEIETKKPVRGDEFLLHSHDMFHHALRLMTSEDKSSGARQTFAGEDQMLEIVGWLNELLLRAMKLDLIVSLGHVLIKAMSSVFFKNIKLISDSGKSRQHLCMDALGRFLIGRTSSSVGSESQFDDVNRIIGRAMLEIVGPRSSH
ncbi:unnamed protein product, partial [Polarella glacialis]